MSGGTASRTGLLRRAQAGLRAVLPVLALHRAPLQILADSVVWAAAIGFALVVRYDLAMSRLQTEQLVKAILVAVALQVVIGLGSGLYLGRWRTASFEQAAAIAAAAGGVAIGLTLVSLLGGAPRLVPLSVPTAAGIMAAALMGGSRYIYRGLRYRGMANGGQRTRLLVFGAGEAGARIVTTMLETADSPYRPVALLDDDPGKRYLRIRNVKVVGTRRDLVHAAQRHGAEELLVALPNAEGALLRELSEIAAQAKLPVSVLPSVAEFINRDVELDDIRPLTEADLLGRHQIDTDIASIAGYLTGKRVLVTGAGGSIGAELCRQIYRFAPAELIMLDRDESALHAVQLSIHGRALLDGADTVLADIRDGSCLRAVFAERRPEVVFHAAALKHLPLLEQYPAEGVKTNVWGTIEVLQAAKETGVERFVNISTDKAADPTSVLGYTKRIGERLTAHYAAETDGAYMSVRFGNVLGSRGSVLTTFREQIRAGGPVTVTHPDVTRYFMTIEEAVQLVIQAGAIGRDNDVLVLDMGEPVRIAEVAERLVAQADRPIEIHYTGLRPGEKLHEVLLGSDEQEQPSPHPLIAQVRVEPLDPRLAFGLEVATAGPDLAAGRRSLAALSHNGHVPADRDTSLA